MSYGKYSEAINAIKDVGGNILSPLISPYKRGLAYAGGTGEKSVRGLAGAMFGGSEGELTHFTVGEGADALHLNGARIAGGVAGLGIGYRFLSGGGAYRDKNGNTDIAGIPFV